MEPHGPPYRQLTKNFHEREFRCPCCGMVAVDPELVEKLQQMRDILGEPITINSGYRCYRHNRSPEVNGAINSQHLYGKAADCTCFDWQSLFGLAVQIGFRGIHEYPNLRMTHVDTRPKPARW